MGRFLTPGALVAMLFSCAVPGHAPTPNPSPQERFTLDIHKDAGLEAHVRVVYVSAADDCLIHRPVLGGDVVRTIYGEIVSIPAEQAASPAELVVDSYLPGACRWRPTTIQVSINRPPFSAAHANWVPLASFDLPGSAGSNETAFECRPRKRGSNALWCKGPVAFVRSLPGRLRVSFTVNDTIELW